ncbi:MAG TPA: FtsX-like permease family protein [Caulobacteraceae bacterium]
MSDQALDPGRARWRPAPLLPKEDERDGSLVFVVAVLCFLACVAALAAVAADRAASGWRGELAGEVLVQARPLPDETSAAAAARAAAVLAGVPGVVQTEALPASEAEDLLEPWLGQGNMQDLPVPHLVIVELDPTGPADPGMLGAALKRAGVDAEVHDYDAYLDEVRRAGSVARGGAVGVASLIATAAAAVIAFATRAGMAARREVLEVLHLSGAEDRMLSRLFQARFAKLAFMAGVIGAGSAAFVAGLIRSLGGAEGFLPILPVEWTDLPWLALCPLLAGGIAAIAARRTSMDLLTAME